MFKSYFKIAFRNLWRHKSFSFINISGLAVGMATCVLIMLYVIDETTYDKHHTDASRLYRIASEVNGEKWVAAPAPMAQGLKNDFPEVETATRLLRFPGAEKMLVKSEETSKQFYETNAYYVDSTFFELFSYDLKFGDGNTALNGPNSIVISEKVSEKFFGNDDPVGKVLNIGLSFGSFDYTVTGVLKDTGVKSHIPANLLLSMNNQDLGGWVKDQTSWASNSIFHTYVKLREGTDALGFESKLNDFLERNGGAEFKAAGFSKELFIQPVKDIYLHSNYGYEVAANGNIRYLYILSSIAVFLLLIACINFMNLSTARSENRAREVGMRKVTGAARSALVVQFLMESILMSALALTLAIVLIELAIPVFNQLTDKEISLLQLPYAYLWLTSLAVATGLIAGIYPAFYLSSFRPISVLKGKRMNTMSAIAVRKGLVVFQFGISIILILGVIIIGQQMKFLGHQTLGFSKHQKIILPIQTNEAVANTEALKNELANLSPVVSAATGSSYPGIEMVTSMLFRASGNAPEENVEIRTTFVDEAYIRTLGIELLSGRGFSKSSGDTDALVLNQSAIHALGFTLDNAIGQKVQFDLQNETHNMRIIAVVRDYHFESLHQRIKPLALTIAPVFSGPASYLIADVNSNQYGEVIAAFEKKWKEINGDSPFAYSFLDVDFQRNYKKEARTSTLIRYFTLIAISIACLGLFGLAAFTAEQRVKEIGVRKVLGASVAQIVSHLSKDMMKLVFIAIVLSAPIAYYAMDKWLQNFAYHINIEWWAFVVAGLAATLIAFMTVSFQAIKAAVANPVDSLRSE